MLLDWILAVTFYTEESKAYVHLILEKYVTTQWSLDLMQHHPISVWKPVQPNGYQSLHSDMCDTTSET